MSQEQPSTLKQHLSHVQGYANLVGNPQFTFSSGNSHYSLSQELIDRYPFDRGPIVHVTHPEINLGRNDRRRG